jgi:uncharacterized membrane protein
VLIMIAGHAVDSWTQMPDRSRPIFQGVLFVGGIGAPLFLFLAGIALSLAAGSRVRRGFGDAAAAARAMRRGVQIFALAFVFQLQSWLVSGGSVVRKLLRVEILHVIGLSMLLAALLWRLGRTAGGRGVLLASGAVAVAMATPPARASELVRSLPEFLQWYVQLVPGRSTFTLFPWAGFLLAGAALGIWLDAAATPARERRQLLALAAAGPAIGLAGYGASFLPPLYADATFWTSSPTFFFARLGVLVTALPVAFTWSTLTPRWSPVREMGTASLFVYWVHLDIVYGPPSRRLHGGLTAEQALAAFVIFTILLYGLVRLKGRFWDGRHSGPVLDAQRRTP